MLDLLLGLSLKCPAAAGVKDLTSGACGDIESCWPLRQATWPFLPLSSASFPWSRTPWMLPALPPQAWSKKWSGPNKRGQGSSTGRFMSLCSSPSLLAERISSKLQFISSWWMMNLYWLAVLFFLLPHHGIDTAAEQRLKCEIAGKRPCLLLYCLYIKPSLNFLLWHQKEIPALVSTWNYLQDKQAVRASAQFRVLKMYKFTI